VHIINEIIKWVGIEQCFTVLEFQVRRVHVPAQVCVGLTHCAITTRSHQFTIEVKTANLDLALNCCPEVSGQLCNIQCLSHLQYRHGALTRLTE